MDESKFNNTLKLIIRLNDSTYNSKITTTIDILSKTKIKSTYYLINKIYYLKSKKQDQIK